MIWSASRKLAIFKGVTGNGVSHPDDVIYRQDLYMRYLLDAFDLWVDGTFTFPDGVTFNKE